MKPFLLLSTRPEDDAALGEWEAIARLAGLRHDQLLQIRVEEAPMAAPRLEEFSGVFLGGGPYNASDTDKSPLQQRVEADLSRVIAEVVERDFQFLGLCYGVGAITAQLGGVVDRSVGEDVGVVTATLTAHGREDPIFDGVPHSFQAFTAHKEGCRVPAAGSTVLATGGACPIQAFRIGRRVYATQFHPELDSAGLAARIRIYRDAGYFDPADTEQLVAFAESSTITHAVHGMLRNFVALAAQSR